MKLKGYDTIGEQVYSEKLSNGLNVFVIRKRGYSKSYAFFATNYGGADRRFRLSGNWIDTPEGVAHFLEHKMFDTPDGNALADLSANGASPNAFTSSDITAYHFESVEGFEENLRILLNFVSVPYFTDESVSKEQGIIGQEIRMTDDEPDYTVYFGLMKSLYEHHPMRDSVAGTIESIAEITADTLYSCHKVFYNPSNMVLCVVGDVDPERVCSIARSVLPPEPGEVPARDYGAPESPKAVTHRFEKRMEVSMPLFMIGSKVTPPARGAEALRLELTANLALRLLAGESSPLYARLYESGLINNSFSAEYEAVADQAYAVFSGESADPDAVESALREQIASVCAEGFSSEYFDRVKKAYAGSIIRALNSFDNICYNYAKGFFRGFDYFTASDVLAGISADDAITFIEHELTPEKSALAVIVPNS